MCLPFGGWLGVMFGDPRLLSLLAVSAWLRLSVAIQIAWHFFSNWS